MMFVCFVIFFSIGFFWAEKRHTSSFSCSHFFFVSHSSTIMVRAIISAPYVVVRASKRLPPLLLHRTFSSSTGILDNPADATPPPTEHQQLHEDLPASTPSSSSTASSNTALDDFPSAPLFARDARIREVAAWAFLQDPKVHHKLRRNKDLTRHMLDTKPFFSTKSKKTSRETPAAERRRYHWELFCSGFLRVTDGFTRLQAPRLTELLLESEDVRDKFHIPDFEEVDPDSKPLHHKTQPKHEAFLQFHYHVMW